MINKNIFTSTFLIAAGLSLVACGSGHSAKQAIGDNNNPDIIKTFEKSNLSERIAELGASIEDKKLDVTNLTDENFELGQKIKEEGIDMDELTNSLTKMTDNQEDIKEIKSELNYDRRQLKLLTAQEKVEVLTKRIAKDKNLITSYPTFIQYNPEKSGAINTDDVQADIEKNEKSIEELNNDILRISKGITGQ